MLLCRPYFMTAAMMMVAVAMMVTAGVVTVMGDDEFDYVGGGGGCRDGYVWKHAAVRRDEACPTSSGSRCSS